MTQIKTQRGVSVECPKCQHVRTASDSGPSYACPQCGIVYAKFDPAVEERDAALRVKLAGRIQRQPIETPVKATIESVDEAKLSEPVDEPQSNSFAGNTAVCKNCEEIGQVGVKLPGSGWVEFVLYLLWIAPGILYSVWRRKGTKQVCAACGSDQLVAAKTRAGKQIIAGQYEIFKIEPDRLGQFKPPTFGRATSISCGVLSASMLFSAGAMLLSRSDAGALAVINGLFALWLGWAAFRCWNNKPIAVKVGQGLIGR
jgi:hypothetical protein